MLQNIRDNIQGVAAKIIIGLMIIPFALYGIDFLFSGSSETPVAIVNGEKVSEYELNQALGLQKRRLLAMMGDNIDPGLLDDAVLRKPALDSLVRQKVLLQAAQDAGVAVPDSVLNSNIVQMEQFREAGQFSPELFRQILSAQGFSPQLFRQLLRSDLLIDQLNQGVVGSSFLTGFQQQTAYRLGDQKRTFHYLILDTAHFADQAEVGDDEIAAYYDENAARFKTAESVRVSYLELKESDFYEPVSEADLRAAYQQEIEAAEARAERHAAHILIEGDDAEARIAELQSKLAAGEDFAALAREHSDDFGSAEQGGDLGYSAGSSFPEPFEKALASLEEGQVSEPVETESGLHLVKLLDIRTPDVPGFDERRAAIETQLQSQAAKPRLVAEVEALRDLVFNADGLEEPARSLELDVQQSDWLTPLQNDGLMAYPAVKAAAFNAELREQGYNSEVIEVSPSHYVVLHPQEYRAPELKALETVRGDIVAALKTRKARELAQTAADEITAELEAGASAEDLAKSRGGVEWQVAVRAPRQDPSVPQAVRSLAFELNRPVDGGSRVAASVDGAQPVVVQLTNVYDGDESLMGDDRRRELLANAQRIQQTQGFNAYFASLMQAAEIQYN